MTARATYAKREGFVLHVDVGGTHGAGECTPLVEFGTEDMATAMRAMESLPVDVEPTLPGAAAAARSSRDR